MEVMLDLEVYKDYFLAKFMEPDGTTREWSAWPGKTFAAQEVIDYMRGVTSVTFSGNNYDIPILSLAFTGVDTYALKKASDEIIVGGLKPWEFREVYGLQWWPRELDHVDIREVAPGVGVSLKMFAGRGHSRQMQDLPIDPTASISPMDRMHLSKYCANDLEVTRDLWRAVEGRMRLRLAMGERYGIDLRSKSDAQIAEAVIKERLGFRPERRVIQNGYQFHYEPPANIAFQTAKLAEVFAIACAQPFTVYDAGQVPYRNDPDDPILNGLKMTDTMRDLTVTIGATTYQLGSGGLHSCESKENWHTIAGRQELSMPDVSSYYPTLIRKLGMYPQQLGPRFLELYGEFYDERLYHKAQAAATRGTPAHAEHKTFDDSGKIILNGTFGKLGSKYSIFYAPELLIRVTLTGQLYLLMLIEALELAGISVKSANTDGIVILCPWHLRAERDRIIKEWEAVTGMTMDNTPFTSLYARDVNNYVGFTASGEVKKKGVFTESGILSNKHPAKDICGVAVTAWLKSGTPIADTINACDDIRKFIVVRQVRGGATYFPTGTKAVADAKRAYTAARNRSAAYQRKHGEDCPERSAAVIDAADALRVAEAERDACGTYLGKAVRWYHGFDDGAEIGYSASGNLVATSSGAVPAMELPATIPADLNRDWYIAAAQQMLDDLGV